MTRRLGLGKDTWAASLASRYWMRYPKAEWSWSTSCKGRVHNNPFFCQTCSHPDRLWKSTPLLALTPRTVCLAQVHGALRFLILRLCDEICERPLSALIGPSRNFGLRERGSRRHVLACLDPPLFQTSQERHVSLSNPWKRQHWRLGRPVIAEKVSAAPNSWALSTTCSATARFDMSSSVVKVVACICQSGYMYLLKFLHVFVKLGTRIRQNSKFLFKTFIIVSLQHIALCKTKLCIYDYDESPIRQIDLKKAIWHLIFLFKSKDIV